MKNWAVDIKQLKKNPQKYQLWKIEQLINYGLEGNERIAESELRKYWPQIKDRLDPYKKRYLEYLLWGKTSSLPNNLNFWNLLTRKKQSKPFCLHPRGVG
jgi:hypothetical protein